MNAEDFSQDVFIEERTVEEEELRELEILKSDADLLVRELVTFASRVISMYEEILVKVKNIREKIDRDDFINNLRLNLDETSSLVVKLDQFKMKLLGIICRFSAEVHSVFKYYLYEYLPAKYHEIISKRSFIIDLIRDKRTATALMLFIEYLSDLLDLASQLFSIARGLAESIGKYYDDFKQYYEQVKRQYEKSREIQSGLLPSVI